MAKKLRTETYVGLFLIIGILLVSGFVVLLGNFKSSENAQYPIYLVYKDAAGLIKGSNVRMGGAAVGVVSSQPKLTEEGNSVMLEVRINNDVHIPREAEFRIDMQNLLGDKYIDIVIPAKTSGQYISRGEVVTGHSHSDLAKIRENAVLVSTELVNILQKLDQNSDGLKEAIDEIGSTARDLSEVAHRINTELLSEKNVTHISNILDNIEKSTQGMPEVVDETKTSVVEFKNTMTEAREFIAEANKSLAKLDAGIAQIEPTMLSFRNTADGMSKITDNLNKGRGTMGLLLQDQKFRKEFEMFIRNLRDYGILRYRNPNEPEPLADPRAGYSGSRR